MENYIFLLHSVEEILFRMQTVWIVIVDGVEYGWILQCLALKFERQKVMSSL